MSHLASIHMLKVITVRPRYVNEKKHKTEAWAIDPGKNNDRDETKNDGHEVFERDVYKKLRQVYAKYAKLKKKPMKFDALKIQRWPSGSKSM